MPRTNTLTYLASSSATKETSFITLALGLNLIKLLSSSLTLPENKLVCLSTRGEFFSGKLNSQPLNESLETSITRGGLTSKH